MEPEKVSKKPMMHRKDLVYAALTGTALSITACLLFVPRDKTLPLLVQETALEDKTDVRQTAPRVPVTERDLQVSETLTGNNTPSQAAAIRRKKPVMIAGKPQSPHANPPLKGNAPNPPAAPQEATTPPVPVPPNLSASGVARVITPQEARAALREVGSNPEAEALWIAAINDPNLSAHQRKDLIEDLNEEGFADPKHLTAADLPRIENRLALIEELAPESIDQTNADAFQEAYKDLKTMQGRLSSP